MTPPGSTGREVTLEAPGGEAVLSLRESPTTGYLWRIVDLPPEVEVADSSFAASAAGGPPGAGGERRITVRASAAGTFRFAAESARGDGPAAERVAVTLVAAQPWTGA